ncbi:hypothetical protein O0L34_g10535 [Tuta absoluta]|nr:hypothetical protein O0L34_g10535 [Tuta absoluta]
MSKPTCGECSRALAATGGVTCPVCVTSYHNKCVNIRSNTSEWVCPACKQTTNDSSPRPAIDQLQNTSVGDQDSRENQDLSTLIKEIREMRIELRRMNTLITECKEDIGTVGLNVTACMERIDLVSKEVQDLTDRVEKLESTHSNTDSQLQLKVTFLEEQLHAKAQELIQNDLEITGVSETVGENVQQLVQVLAVKIGVDLHENDVVDVYRAGRSRSPQTPGPDEKQLRPRPIILRLARRAPRDNFLRNARVRRNLTTTDMGLPGSAKRVYVNERLTGQNRLLFKRAKDEKKLKDWKYVWTKNGKILAKQGEGDSKVYHIAKASYIEKVFGNAVVGTEKN